MAAKAIVKTSGTGVQGHQRTAEENARAVLHVQQHCERGASFDAAVKATATAEVASPNTIRTAVYQFSTTGNLVPREDRRSQRNHPFYKESGPSLAAELLIHHVRWRRLRFTHARRWTKSQRSSVRK